MKSGKRRVDVGEDAALVVINWAPPRRGSGKTGLLGNCRKGHRCMIHVWSAPLSMRETSITASAKQNKEAVTIRSLIGCRWRGRDAALKKICYLKNSGSQPAEKDSNGSQKTSCFTADEQRPPVSEVSSILDQSDNERDSSTGEQLGPAPGGPGRPE